MEIRRFFYAFASEPNRVLFCIGLALLLIPESGFNSAYDSMFSVAPKDLWGVLITAIACLGFFSLYVGSAKLYQVSLIFCAAAFAFLSVIFFSSGLAPGGALTYLNLAVSGILLLSGAPVYGFISQPKPMLFGKRSNQQSNKQNQDQDLS